MAFDLKQFPDQYRNASSETDMPATETTATEKRDWNKIGVAVADTFETISDLINGIIGRKPTVENKYPTPTSDKPKTILGMPPVLGGTFIVVGLGLFGFMIWQVAKSKGIQPK